MPTGTVIRTGPATVTQGATGPVAGSSGESWHLFVCSYCGDGETTPSTGAVIVRLEDTTVDRLNVNTPCPVPCPACGDDGGLIHSGKVKVAGVDLAATFTLHQLGAR